FTDPGKIVEVTRSGRVTWSFGSLSGPDRLDRPSLALPLPNGLIAANDDWNHRVIVVDPRTKAIVWQYGRTGVAGTARGLLDKPDGLDLLPSAFLPARQQRVDPVALRLRRVGTLPLTLTKSASVALPGGRLMVLGGEGSNSILLGPPSHLRVAGRLATATHDAAAVVRGRSVLLYGGGASVSTPAVVRVDPVNAATQSLHPL